jgi:hypothetical protein
MFDRISRNNRLEPSTTLSVIRRRTMHLASYWLGGAAQCSVMRTQAARTEGDALDQKNVVTSKERGHWIRKCDSRYGGSAHWTRKYYSWYVGDCPRTRKMLVQALEGAMSQLKTHFGAPSLRGVRSPTGIIFRITTSVYRVQSALLKSWTSWRPETGPC